MLKTIMLCDMCKEEIPAYEKEILPGIKKKIYKIGKSKYMPHLTNTLNVHLCEKCAPKLDVEILEWKMSVLENLENKRGK